MTVESQQFGITGEFTISPTARTPFPETKLMLDGMTLGPCTVNTSPVCLDEGIAGPAR